MPPSDALRECLLPLCRLSAADYNTILAVEPEGTDSSPPRAALVGEDEVQWEATAAFKHMDRPVVRWLAEPLGRDLRVKHVSVGRSVLERRRYGRVISAFICRRAALLHYADENSDPLFGETFYLFLIFV